ncbi:MAG: hypothetical protein Q7U54_17340 [Bacteroidales bacterium]|nr:hypothetical protein [Bacteroidales bacterium]
MKTKLISLLLIVSASAIGQINFESGYFINNNNQRIECLIKNADWKNNPTEFDYKTSTSAETEKGTLSSVKEFGITDFSRYVRVDTKIDLSSTDVNILSKTSDPEWSQKIMFLKVLVEGKASLYYYENNGLIRFFYATDSDTIVKQLIYKEYFDQKNKDYVEAFDISSNNKFHAQLWTDVRCPSTTTNVIEQLKYQKSELQKYFIKYNKCFSSTPLVYGKKTGEDFFHLKICPGINYSSIAVSNLPSSIYEGFTADFGNQASFRIGLEGELTLPFNRNKWAVFLEPTFEYYNSNQELSNVNLTVRLNTIEFPAGLRYYSFLNHGIKLFADVIFIPAYFVPLDSKLIKENTVSSILPESYKLQSNPSFAFGGGIMHKKYSAEFRYYTNRDIMNNYPRWDSEYMRFSLILGFRIL